MVITVCNFKGGVGKTTTVHALATTKGIQGKKVLAIDLDGQHSLTTSCGIDVKRFTKNNYTISDLLTLEIENVDSSVEDIKETIIHLNNIDLIPSTKLLSFCDKDLTKSGRIDVLDNILKKISVEYDYIFVDCSPTRNSLCENAIFATTNIIIPVESYYLGSEGLYDFIDFVQELSLAYNKNVMINGILLTMFQKNTNLCESIKNYVMNAINKNFGNNKTIKNIKVFNEVIPRSIKVAEANLDGKSIVEYLPNNPVSKAYINIANLI